MAHIHKCAVATGQEEPHYIHVLPTRRTEDVWVGGVHHGKVCRPSDLPRESMCTAFPTSTCVRRRLRLKRNVFASWGLRSHHAYAHRSPGRMASRSDAQLEIDEGLQTALRVVHSKVCYVLRGGHRILPTEIATTFLDEAFGDLAENLSDVFHDLDWEGGDEMRQEVLVEVEVATANTEQECWEAIQEIWDEEDTPDADDVLESLEGFFWPLRERIAELVDSALSVASPSCSSAGSSSYTSESQEGDIVLPLRRRRREL